MRSKEEREALKKRAGEYNKSNLNDLKLDSGEWLTSVRVDGKMWATRGFAVWQSIRQRCAVGGSFQKRFPHYRGTTVCKEWAECFQAFANWYTGQIGYVEGWDVDKDALRGGKHYSPDTCLLLPRAVNLMFGKQWFQCGKSLEYKLAAVEARRLEYTPLGVRPEVFDNLAKLILSDERS